MDKDQAQCAAKELLWPWMDIAGEAEMRHDALVKDIGDLKRREEQVEASLTEANARAVKLMEAWDGEERGKVEMVKQRLLDVEKRYREAGAHRASLKANAEIQAKESKDQNVNTYYDIRNAGHNINGKAHQGGDLNYAAVKVALESNELARPHCERGIVSEILRDLNIPLNRSPNLSQWKDTNQKVLERAKEQLVRSGPSCCVGFNSFIEKAKSIEETIARTVERLQLAVSTYEEIEKEVNTAYLNTRAEQVTLDKTEKSILKHVDDQGKQLCEMLKKQRSVTERVRSARAQLVGTTTAATALRRRASELTQQAEGTRTTVTLASMQFSMLTDTLVADVRSSTYTREIKTARTVVSTGFEAAVDLYVQSAKRAAQATKQTEKDLREAGRLLENAEVTLGQCESQNHEQLGVLKGNDCHTELSSTRQHSLQHGLSRSLAEQNEVLLKCRYHLDALTPKVDLLEARLINVHEQNQHLEDQLKTTEKLRKASNQQAEDAVANVTMGLAKQLCAYAKEIHQIKQENSDRIVYAEHLRTRIYNAHRTTEGARTTSYNVSGMQPSVVENLTNALGAAVVLEHQINRTIVESKMLLNTLEARLKSASQIIANPDDGFVAFMHKITLTITDPDTMDHCTGAWMADVVAEPKSTPDELLGSVSALKKLGQFIKCVQEAVSQSRRDTTDLALVTDEQRKAVEGELGRSHDLALKVAQAKKKSDATAFAQALVGIMETLCGYAQKIHTLQAERDKLEGTVVTLKDKVSTESKIAKQGRQTEAIPQDVEDGFTYASRRVSLLEKHLHQTNALYKTVVKELVERLKKASSNSVTRHTAIGNLVRDITSDVTDFSSRSLCKELHIPDVVALLMTGNDTMLENVSALDNLRKFTAKIDEQVKVIKRKMGKVASSAADAQAAVEEAIRRAHEAAAGRRCTPLHRQLLNVVQHIW
ncbi:hypothetical protein ERJ75_000082100 [Trypanosoma vivax]|nr:hypothetical protein ERJ75_000082100 [Trypanosoma vivax]